MDRFCGRKKFRASMAVREGRECGKIPPFMEDIVLRMQLAHFFYSRTSFGRRFGSGAIIDPASEIAVRSARPL